MLNERAERQQAKAFADDISEKYTSLAMKYADSTPPQNEIAALLKAAQKWTNRIAIQPQSQRGSSPAARQIYADFMALEASSRICQQETLQPADRTRLSQKFLTLMEGMPFEQTDAHAAAKRRNELLRKVHDTYTSLEKFEIAAAVYSFADQYNAESESSEQEEGKKKKALPEWKKIRSAVETRLSALNKKAFSMDVYDNQISAVERCARALNAKPQDLASYRIPVELIAFNAAYPEMVVVMTWVYYTFIHSQPEFQKTELTCTEFFPLRIGAAGIGLYLGEKNQKELFSDKVKAYWNNNKEGDLRVAQISFEANDTLYSLALSKHALDLFLSCNKESADPSRYIEISEKTEDTFNFRAAIDQVKKILAPAALKGLRKGEKIDKTILNCQLKNTLKSQYSSFAAKSKENPITFEVKAPFPERDFISASPQPTASPETTTSVIIWLLKQAVVLHWLENGHFEDQEQTVEMEQLYKTDFLVKLADPKSAAKIQQLAQKANLHFSLQTDTKGVQKMKYIFFTPSVPAE